MGEVIRIKDGPEANDNQEPTAAEREAARMRGYEHGDAKKPSEMHQEPGLARKDAYGEGYFEGKFEEWEKHSWHDELLD